MAKPIFLIGYMCSGKTTLGRALERALGIPYIDLDEMIELEQGMTVGEIFANHGEEAFRAMESDALSRVAAMTGIIVGCGGGTPCRQANMELMNRCGTTVLLRPSRERLLARLRRYRSTRPLIATLSDSEIEATMKRGLEEREKFYQAAAMEFDSSYLESDQEIASTVKEFKSTIIDTQ